MSTNAGYAGADANIDRESVCFTTTAGGDTVFTGTIRHDDALTGMSGTEFGWALFDQNQSPVPATTPGLTFVSCDQCCPIVLGEGCWRDGTESGQWASVQDPDGTVRVIDTATGDPVLPANFVACSEAEFVTEVRDVTNTSFTITGADLFSWAVRKRTGTVSVIANGAAAVTMDDGETIASEARSDGLLADDSIVVNASGGAGNSARVVIVRIA